MPAACKKISRSITVCYTLRAILGGCEDGLWVIAHLSPIDPSDILAIPSEFIFSSSIFLITVLQKMIAIVVVSSWFILLGGATAATILETNCFYVNADGLQEAAGGPCGVITPDTVGWKFQETLDRWRALIRARGFSCVARKATFVLKMEFANGVDQWLRIPPAVSDTQFPQSWGCWHATVYG